MATSGITISEITRDQIITGALRKIGVIGEGASANPTQITEGAEALGPLVQELQTLGMPLWKRTDLTIDLVPGVRTYTIGVGKQINVPFPMKISQAVLYYNASNSIIDINLMAKYDFQLLPLNATGTVVNACYQPFINYGELSVWPTPTSASQKLVLTYQEAYDVFATGSDTADFPQEWQNALIYQLALILADEYSLPIADKQWLEKQADKRLASALSFGTEEVSIKFAPTYNGER